MASGGLKPWRLRLQEDLVAQARQRGINLMGGAFYKEPDSWLLQVAADALKGLMERGVAHHAALHVRSPQAFRRSSELVTKL